MPGPEYRPALDGLRAIAVALVVVFHLGHLPGGILGVDAFFVVSGWLITFILVNGAERRGSLDLAGFWSSRLRRLMPASLAMLAAVAVVWPLLGIVVSSLRRDILFSLVGAANWGIITGGGDYWARFGDPSPLNHMWSLAIEQQFYLVWPLVVLVVSRSRLPLRATIGLVAAAGAVGSVVFMIVWFDPVSPTSTYMNTLARAHTLLIGAAAATVTRPGDGGLRGGAVATRLGPLAAVVAAWIVIAAADDSVWLFRWGFPAFALAMVVVVVAAADGAGARLLGSAPMRWIGDRSYGLYLWHWPAFLLMTPGRMRFDGWLLDLVRVVAAVLLADLSLRFVENPIRRRRVLAGRAGLAALAGAMAGVAALAVFVVPAGGGGPGSSVITLPPVTSAPTATTFPQGTTATTVHTTETGAASTVPPTSAAPIGPARVLVVGDSMAVHLSGQLITLAEERPDQILIGSAAFPGCGLSASDDGRLHQFTNEQGKPDSLSLAGCVPGWRSIPQRVVDEQIDLVLVDIGAWDAVDIQLADGRVVSLADPVGRALIDDSYRSFVETVEAAGASVVWVTPPDADLQWGAVDSPLDQPERWRALREIIDSLPVEQIDLPGWLADNGLEGPDGRPDGVHLAEVVGVRFAGELVIPRLLEVYVGRG